MSSCPKNAAQRSCGTQAPYKVRVIHGDLPRQLQRLQGAITLLLSQTPTTATRQRSRTQPERPTEILERATNIQAAAHSQSNKDRR
eukprot:3331288-Amphidinium_carterae.2